MRPTVLIREYDHLSGEVIKLHDTIGFGEILSGDISGVRVFDFVVTGVSDVSDFNLSISDSEGIEVSPPDAVVISNTADKGNFGLETASSFSVKSSLTRFFAYLDTPVSIQMRSDYVSYYVYLSLSPGTYEKTGGIIKYKVAFKYDSSISSSSASLVSSSSSSSGSTALLIYADGVSIKSLYFQGVAESCEYKSIIYENVDSGVEIFESPCESNTWVIYENDIFIGSRNPGVHGSYSNGWLVN